MNRWMLYVCGVIILIGSSSYAFNGTGSVPIKYISSCELDLNSDDKTDIVFLIESTKDRELIILMRTSTGYNAFIVSKGKPDMQLSCHFGKSIKETLAGKGKRESKVYETPGAYVQLAQPEGSSVIYFWTGDGFKEVWTAD